MLFGFKRNIFELTPNNQLENANFEQLFPHNYSSNYKKLIVTHDKVDNIWVKSKKFSYSSPLPNELPRNDTIKLRRFCSDLSILI